MTPSRILLGVQKRVQAVLDGFTVYAGYAKPRKGLTAMAEDTRYPLAVVGMESMTDDDGQSSMTVGIAIVLRNESLDGSGFLELMSAVERVRQDLLKNRYIEGYGRVELPFKVELPAEQMYPDFMAYITFGTLITQPEEEITY